MSYWYLEGRDGVQACYSKHLTFRCPFEDGIEGGDVYLEATTPRLRAAAAEIGLTKLSNLIRDGHRRMYGGSADGLRARDEDGKLTDRCRACGAKLERKGFAVWVQVEIDPDDETAQTRIADRLGFSNTRRVGQTKYMRTKRKAHEWAIKRSTETRAAATRAAA